MLSRRWVVCALVLGVACKGTEPVTLVPTTIDVSPAAVNFGALTRVRTLAAVVRDQRGDTIVAPSVQWGVGNGTVASVDATGRVTALGLGVTQVYATVQRNSGPIRDSATITVTQVPAGLVKVLGDQQFDTASGTLPTSIVVQVNDSTSHGIRGVIVTFAVTQGGGNVSASTDTTDFGGRASTSWTLGPVLGANTLGVTAAGGGITGNPLSFGATAVAAGAGRTVSVLAGDGETGLTGSMVNVPPAVVFRDGLGTPLAGKSVTFAVTGGGGSLQGAAATTDANGVARVGSWSLTAGANALTATVNDTGVIIGNPVSFTATGVSAAYHIDVRFLVPTTPARQAVFTAAASRWESLIIGDVPDFLLSVATNQCVSGQPAIHETVDDILIYAILDSIDGPGKILGQAGPCFVRSGSLLPVFGVMKFDTADVAALESSGRFALVIEHEMGHVLGYGTIWGNLLVDPVSTGNPGADPHFVGIQALAAFDRSGGASYSLSAKVPLENTGGTGTANAHWRETVFKNELMTGFINSGANPLSVVSTASMGDLGYLVNYAASDTYVVPPAPPVSTGGSILVMGNDILRMPIMEVDAAGRVVRTVAPR
jgi:hypothetical protein